MEDETTRLSELELAFREIAKLVQSDVDAIPRPAVLVEELRGRMRELERLRVDHWESRFELSRHLALRQVDALIQISPVRQVPPGPAESIERRSRSRGAPLFCLLVAVDQPIFGSEDPTLSHLLLVQAAQRIMLSTRCDDMVLRYREEGFLLISNSGSQHEAQAHATRVSRAVGAAPVKMGARDLDLSISVSIVCYEKSRGGANQVIQLAWAALREAQRRGPRKIIFS